MIGGYIHSHHYPCSFFFFFFIFRFSVSGEGPEGPEGDFLYTKKKK
jgi:hypothetical protein